MFIYSVKAVQDTWNGYISLTDVHKENQNLKEEINQLKLEALKHREREKTFERLNKMLDYKIASNAGKILASVIGADPASWSRMITIDKGTNQGIQKNMVVVTHEGLVGHITRTLPGYSRVLLITDARSAVDVLDQNERVRGVVVGKGNDICEMKYIPHDADIRVGSPVISSGLGGVFPKGLLIGKVSHVEEVNRGLFKNVIITPSAKISLLEEVFILK